MKASRYQQLSFTLVILVTARSSICSSEVGCSSSTSKPCQVKEMQVRLETSIELANKVMDALKSMTSTDAFIKPDDCNALFNAGIRSSGVYTLWPRNRILRHSVQAYCDMETDGGGWTVIQRRGNFGREQDSFNKDWISYKTGFGVLSEDFWIGNDLIFAFTNQKMYSLRFDLKDLEGNTRWAKYDDFWIDSEECNYALHGDGYRGDAGDSFSYHFGKEFSAKDRDNDGNPSGHCASHHKGGWWYDHCHHSNLNGLYHSTKQTEGIHWRTWPYNNYSLSFAEMKIKPLSFAPENSGASASDRL